MYFKWTVGGSPLSLVGVFQALGGDPSNLKGPCLIMNPVRHIAWAFGERPDLEQGSMDSKLQAARRSALVHLFMIHVRFGLRTGQLVAVLLCGF